MKKLLAIILAAMMILSVVGCAGGYGEQEQEESPEEKAKKEAEAYIHAYVCSVYNVNNVNVSIATISETRENVFQCSGKVRCKDKYGDSCSGNFDISVEYDPATDSYEIYSYNQADLVRDK